MKAPKAMVAEAHRNLFDPPEPKAPPDPPSVEAFLEDKIATFAKKKGIERIDETLPEERKKQNKQPYEEKKKDPAFGHSTLIAEISKAPPAPSTVPPVELIVT